jgi:hypothetical protein
LFDLLTEVDDMSRRGKKHGRRGANEESGPYWGTKICYAVECGGSRQ